MTTIIPVTMTMYTMAYKDHLDLKLVGRPCKRRGHEIADPQEANRRRRDSGVARRGVRAAKDFFRNEVLPFQNQQVSTTLGGPIVRNRVHFFGNYEYERQPQTYVYTSPYAFFNIDQQFTNRVHRYLGRGDVQFTSQARLSVRAVGSDRLFYGFDNGATEHPSVHGPRTRATDEVFATFTQVLSNRSVNEIKGGWMGFDRTDNPIVRWAGGPFPHRPVGVGGSVRTFLPGYTIGSQTLWVFLDTAQLRDDFTTSFTAAGRHDVRMGGEYMRFDNTIGWCLRCDGEIDARTPGARVPANIQALFPVWNDASTWNTAPLAPITRWVTHSLSDTGFYQSHVRHVFGTWFQDDWHASDRLTLNLGVRYDVDSNGHSEKLRFLPWLPGNLPHDTNNVAPRVGFAYSLNDRTVLRGGYGLFFAFAPNDGVHQSQGYCCVRFEWQIFNDGRPNFTAGEAGWLNGPKPTMAAALANACDVNFRPGCSYRSLVQEINYPGRQTSYSHQAGIGVQRQIGNDMSFEANYVYTGGRREEDAPNVNLTFNPTTGSNYRFSDVSRRAFPQWGQVNFELLEGQSNYHAGDFSFTKRFSDRWQANATYTLAGFWDATASPDQWFIGDDGVVARRPIGFPVAPDLGGEYTLAATDQRHRATFNGIWALAHGVQLSGLYFFGSGQRFRTEVGRDNRDAGGASRDRRRLRQDGTIQPRNDVVGDPLHRIDLRLQKRLSLGGRRTIDGIFEVFNLFNHENYGSYVIDEASTEYGQPEFDEALAYQPRMLQLGFRVAF